MSENRHNAGPTINWRGPLLAAGIFGAVFAILLLMARQNQSNTSEMGSSLRQDPYGTSLLFDSYARAGYHVKRSQDEDSLSNENASRTTAFFIGGHSFAWSMETGSLPSGERIGKQLENFLARGGRVVLVAPAWKLKSESQGWKVENRRNQTPHESEPTWISPDSSGMPPGSETMFLAADSPWLQTDAQWTILYRGSISRSAGAETSPHVYMAMRHVGNGELLAASQESFLLNEAVKTHPNPVLLDFLVGGRPVIWVDETLHGLHQDQGVLWLVQRYRLQAALLLFWAALLALLWTMSGDLIRRPAHNGVAQIVRRGEVAGVAPRRLLQRSIAKQRVLPECWEQFGRCWPHDAEAISASSVWGPRLRAALALPPLAGYKELSRLIAERRASAKGLAGLDHDTIENSMFNRR